MQSEDDPRKKFEALIITKQSNLVNQTRAFQELVMFMEYKIRDEFKSFSLFALCGSERTKFMVDIYFENAFNNLSLTEKVLLYEKTINNAVEIQKLNTNQSEVQIDLEDEDEDNSQTIRFRVDVEEGFHSWKSRFLQIEGFKIQSNQIHFDIRNYLIRKSKKKNKDCYVLEAIHQSKPQVLRFCFLTNQDLKKYLPKIEQLINIGYKEQIKRMYNIQILKSQNRKRTKKSQAPPTEDSLKGKNTEEKQNHMKKMKLALKPLDEEEEPQQVQILRTQSHVVEEFIKDIQEQNVSMEINEFVANQNQKYQEREKEKVKYREKATSYKNVFNIMFPNFYLSDLDLFERYKVATSNQEVGCFVFQHSQQSNVFKLEVLLKLKPEIVLMVLTNPMLFKNWHPEIVQAETKLNILSQNSAIVYQKHKAYSKWYRERDFLYLRHVFKISDDYFIADKSIQNINYIPFSTIQRGQINYQISKISPSATGSKLLIEINMDHGGLLNRDYANELTCSYLNGFQKMEGYFSMKQFENKLKSFFNSEWVVKDAINSNQALHKHATSEGLGEVQFKSEEISQLDNSDVFFSIKDEAEDIEDKISVHQLQSPRTTRAKQPVYQGAEEIKLNQEGYVILPKTYLTMKHPTGNIQEIADKKQDCPWQNRLLRDHWKLKKEGGLVLIHKKIIEAQDRVLSFMMSTFRKKIFSKQNVTISLPVTIFNSNSQLSQYAESLCCAPLFLEDAAKMSDPVERFKKVMIVGFSQSVLFFDINKPFNPILGETYQSYIGGCPFYAEQISHHPPVTSYLYLGRGYKIFATLEATVNIHLNSGDGINVGWSHVVFDDGQQICFQTPPAQFSGFAMGDREFNFKAKGYYFDEGNNLYAEMNFEDQAGMFSSNKWKFVDQVEAECLSVSSEFLNKFIKQFNEKKHSPSKKDILERHFKITGRWPLNISIDGRQVYDPTQDAPFENIPYQYPLNSNTNYREDLYYRKIQDLSKSQSQKQRLENVQRADRKFRQKYHGKAH